MHVGCVSTQFVINTPTSNSPVAWKVGQDVSNPVINDWSPPGITSSVHTDHPDKAALDDWCGGFEANAQGDLVSLFDENDVDHPDFKAEY